jgi:hypothetical protein
MKNPQLPQVRGSATSEQGAKRVGAHGRTLDTILATKFCCAFCLFPWFRSFDISLCASVLSLQVQLEKQTRLENL